MGDVVGDGGADEGTRRERQQAQAGRQRRLVEADLEVQGQGEQQPDEPGEVQHAQRRAGRHRGVLEQFHADQRYLAPAFPVELPQREETEHRYRRGHAHERPRRPAEVAPLDQRVRQEQQRDGDEQHAERVDRTRLALGFRYQPYRGQERQDADRYVDHEHRAPLPAVQVPLDQQAADERSAGGGDAGDGTVEAVRLPGLLRRERGLDERQDRRVHDAGHDALQDPPADELLGCGGDRAQRGRDREAGHTDEEHQLVAEPVAEPARGYQQQPVGQCVAGDHPLERVVAGVQVLLDRRDRDVHDRRVQQDHEGPGQHHREHDPAPLPSAVGGGCRLLGPGVTHRRKPFISFGIAVPRRGSSSAQ